MVTAKYTALVNLLRKSILEGVYGTEGGLPSASEIAREYNLALNTVKTALYHLEGERLVVKRGTSYYVNKAHAIMTQFAPTIDVSLLQQGKTSFIRNLEPVRRVTLSNHVADMIHAEHGTQVVARLRVAGETIGDKEVPFSVVKYYYIIRLDDNQIAEMENNPYADLLARLYPVYLMRQDDVSSRLPTVQEAQTLRINEITPILDLQSIVRDMENRVLLVQQLAILSTSRRYTYRFDNKPSKG